MRTITATLLGVIAAGVMVIAFELMPRTAAPAAMDVNGQMVGLAHPVNLPVAPGADQPGYYGAPSTLAYAPNAGAIGYVPYEARPVRTSLQTVSYAPRRVATRVERPRRDWAKTAMVIGGTSAAGAGLGAIIGGKKGALIGAALGGGAGTLFEVTKGR